MASEEKVPDAIADQAIADEQSDKNDLPATYEPPLNSPLTGCYLLIILGEPHSQQHKDIILQRLLKGKKTQNYSFRCWCRVVSQMTSFIHFIIMSLQFYTHKKFTNCPTVYHTLYL